MGKRAADGLGKDAENHCSLGVAQCLLFRNEDADGNVGEHTSLTEDNVKRR